jgi:cation transport regulator ChaC
MAQIVCTFYRHALKSLLSHAGPAPREAIALQIASAIGPSGPNAEYLHSLVAALKQVYA